MNEMLLMVQESSDHPHGKDLEIPAINGASMPFYFFVVCFSSLVKNFSGYSPKQKMSYDPFYLGGGFIYIYIYIHILYDIYISNMVYVHPHLGKIPILTNIFELG